MDVGVMPVELLFRYPLMPLAIMELYVIVLFKLEGHFFGSNMSQVILFNAPVIQPCK